MDRTVISRRSLLSGLAAGPFLAAAAAPPAAGGAGDFDLRTRGWVPPVGRQNGPVCAVWSVARALSWWMSRSYGWNHTISLSYPSVLARADARPEAYRMVRVAQDLNITGWVFNQHPGTRLRAGYRIIGNDPSAIRRALGVYRQPVALSLWMPTPEQSSGLDIIDPTTFNGEPSVGHAVWVCGYDSESLLFQNSWGTGWGNNGYGRVSDAWLARYGSSYNIALTSVRVN